MRIGASILFKDGICYQSYKWQYFRPLGAIQNVLDFFDSYKVDEICIIRPVRNLDRAQSLDRDLEILSRIKCSTPVSFGGGLRQIEDLQKIENLPFERYVFNSILFNSDNKLLEFAIERFGKQAIIGSIPFRYENGIKVFNSSTSTFVPISEISKEMISLCDEILLTHTDSEGLKNGFPIEIVNELQELGLDNNFILSGGINIADKKRLGKFKYVTSLSIENRILHTEYSIKRKLK